MEERRRFARIPERRRYTRIPESLQISYEVIPIKTINDHIIKDISQGGIRFVTNVFVPKDSKLKIRITFPRTLFSFEALAKCMWIREIPYSGEFEIGVEFLDIPTEIVGYLTDHIKKFLNIKEGNLDEKNT